MIYLVSHESEVDLSSRDWETQFRQWAKPPSKTEQERCDNALSAVRQAVAASTKLRPRQISVFCHGSYRNNTNVRQDSDVDVGILCTDVCFCNLPEGTTDEMFGLKSSNYGFDQYKNEVEDALVNHFGRTAVKRGNKAFDVHETSYHVEADIAPFFEHRRYQSNGVPLKGAELRTDKGNSRIINWPEQHYENGVGKNTATGMRFKSIVRVLKALSNEMLEANIKTADIPGFLVECSVWNVPNANLQNTNYTENVRDTLIFLYNNTKNDELCKEWGEVSELKYLFRPSQRWTREQMNAFTLSAWNYVGFRS